VFKASVGRCGSDTISIDVIIHSPTAISKINREADADDA
jgi:hypothetical protein